ncbi:Hypothetical_protein [Hexamita inflata]|uniref:Hypothetical_protein n=1 Tax=Hexamita inflata TaxID=28002 RepID=A0AA86S4B8_9EUKA|nr:Hypothetical protein HINF_LOCUS65470 [Hexamita inflata]
MIQDLCASYTQASLTQKQVESGKQISDELFLSQCSSDGKPIKVKCNHNKVNKYTLSNFAKLRFRQLLISALNSIPKTKSIKKTLRELTNEQICEVVDALGKQFWDLVQILNAKENGKALKYFYLTEFKAK